MSNGSLHAVLCGTATHYPSEGDGEALSCEWYTAYIKRPCRRPVRVEITGLAGDEQADTLRHGGVEKAILAYAHSHYARWESELGIRSLPHGAFGENLVIAGQEEASVCLGDVYRCGSALVQALQPRQPGWKVARRWQHVRLPKLVGAARRTGWYLKVLEPGEIQVGDPLTLVERTHPEWTILRAIEVLYARDRDPAPAQQLARCPALGESWKIKLKARFKIDY